MTAPAAVITPEELGALVRGVLGPHTDVRVAGVLLHGRLHVDHDIASWESSMGPVRAHRVRIGLPPDLLGAPREHPHVRDEVTRLLGAAMARRLGETIAEIVFFEEGSATLAAGPYRT